MRRLSWSVGCFDRSTVNRTVTAGLGFIYGEVQAAKDGVWILTPYHRIPIDLYVEQADGT